jgi:GDP/UDP-N,N'-diacetylbacillosamine 2-epimerase (hydrolysing)
MNRKICVITGSRSEYGLLRLVMQEIKESSDLTLQVIATGMHLSPDFGLTFKEIEEDGFQIDRKVETLIGDDSPLGIADSMSKGLVGCAKAFNELNPNLIVVLGDRYEIAVAVLAALVAKIPVAHIHGGELTVGAFDDALRHSITKMSHLHFVAAEEYKKRVIQLGEDPERVFLVGGLGVDNISKLALLNKNELEDSLNLTFQEKSLLITFHPVTLENANSTYQMKELLNALSDLENTTLIFTLPNADTGGLELIQTITDFVSNHPNAYAYASLGQIKYLSCIQHVDGVIGNSSSGLTEVPSFNKGTINIGGRQMGRLQSNSVINCDPSFLSIKSALKKLYSREFRSKLQSAVNPYGEGGACLKIVKYIREISLEAIIKKEFYDLPNKIPRNKQND